MKRLFIFGNGASITEGAPHWDKLLSEISKLKVEDILNLKEIKNLSDNSIETIQKQLIINQKVLEKFLNLFFKRHEDLSPSFHDIYPFIQLLIDNNESLKLLNSETYKPTDLQNVLDSLIWLLAATLDCKLSKNETLHNTLLENISSLLGKDDFLKCSFINLNYDILLDNALIRLKNLPNLAVDIDYHIEFANFEFGTIPFEELNKKRPNIDKWQRPNLKNCISLIKLHGSLNWLVCPICNRIELTPMIKGATESIADLYNCVWDSAKQEIRLVPPTIEQPLQYPKIQYLWSVAENEIREADIIYFIGYSLNDYDMHFRKLMKKYSLQKSQKLIYLICRSPNSELLNENDNETSTRYKRFFGKNVRDTGLSFESFCERINFAINFKELLYEKPINFENIIFKSFQKKLLKKNYASDVLDRFTPYEIELIFSIPKSIKKAESIEKLAIKNNVENKVIKEIIRKTKNYGLVIDNKKDNHTENPEKYIHYYIPKRWHEFVSDESKRKYLLRLQQVK